MLTTSHTLQSNRYRIIDQLGQMETGLAYEAFDASLNKKVLLREALIDDSVSGQLRATASDAHLAIAINHRSLLAVKDAFQENGRQYLVMEHVEGKTLGEILERKTTPFPLKDVTNWTDVLLDAIHHLHTSNPPYVHGAVRPQNIKLGPDGRVRLFVFNHGTAETQTASGLDAAVLPYLPIEQIWSGLDVASQKVIMSDYDERSAELLDLPLDAQSDIYSVAATVYHLLTGCVPADALTRSIDLLEGKPDPLRRPNQINAAVPAELAEVLMRALAVRRENRFSSAAIFRQVFRSAVFKAREASPPVRPVREEDLVLEIPVPPAPTGPGPRAAVEAENLRQLELMKQQLREAEKKRLEAEHRAAEAEKLLHERVTQQFNLAEIPEAASEPEFVETGGPGTALPAAIPATLPAGAAEEDLFVPLEEPRKPLFKVVGAAVLFAVACGAGWAIWSASQTPPPTPAATRPADTTVQQPSVPESPIVASDPSEKAPEPAASENQEQSRTAEPAGGLKPRQSPPPQQAKKQPTPSPKPAASQKKSVTLDDLLKDN